MQKPVNIFLLSAVTTLGLFSAPNMARAQYTFPAISASLRVLGGSQEPTRISGPSFDSVESPSGISRVTYSSRPFLEASFDEELGGWSDTVYGYNYKAIDGPNKTVPIILQGFFKVQESAFVSISLYSVNPNAEPLHIGGMGAGNLLGGVYNTFEMNPYSGPLFGEGPSRPFEVWTDFDYGDFVGARLHFYRLNIPYSFSISNNGQMDLGDSFVAFELRTFAYTGENGYEMFNIAMNAHAGEFFSSGGYGKGYAAIDPYIQIDPAYLALNPLARIEVLGGVGNEPLSVSSVPEPASAFFLLAALPLVFLRAKLQLKRAGEQAT